tara:strand:- start:202 stop:510 length:309 start_codon:yes stop_codon:yes gene_type:complete
MNDLRKIITLTVVDNAMIDIDNTGQEIYTFNDEQFSLLIDNLVKNLASSGVRNSLAIKEAIDYEIYAKRKDKEKNLKEWVYGMFFTFILYIGSFAILKSCSS